ncbi:hypothetical protein EKO04_001143 [Ascochyta lentis]|uniref:Uncharacterized protein n=1 Tax=Ascochyta lentis TaxID=205686 RepID=A0A8H7JB98_9PLEO|nr:hypothetical protein EKO04_001143 [Ascochyta lentis]
MGPIDITSRRLVVRAALGQPRRLVSHSLQPPSSNRNEQLLGRLDIRMGNLTLEQMDNMSKNASSTWTATELTIIKHDGEKYVCNIAFASITIAISFALFIAPDTSLVLGIVVKAPDTLGFVSTSARNNPYVDQQVKSQSDRLQAARALRDLRARIGDVRRTVKLGKWRLLRGWSTCTGV